MTTTDVPQLHHYRLSAAFLLTAVVLAMALSLVAAAQPLLHGAARSAGAPVQAAPAMFTVLPAPPMYTVLP